MKLQLSAPSAVARTMANGRQWWRRHGAGVASGAAMLVAGAWLLNPPADRMDGAADVWALSAAYAAEAPRAPPAPPPPTAEPAWDDTPSEAFIARDEPPPEMDQWERVPSPVDLTAELEAPPLPETGDLLLDETPADLAW